MKPDPCPCGSDRTVMIKSPVPDLNGQWYIACLTCGRIGKHGITELEAVRKWNRLEALYFGDGDEH